MFQKLFVVLVSALVLCPQVDASTFDFTSPLGGKLWTSTAPVDAQGSTNVPAGDKIRVNFGYGASGTEYIENYVIHTVIGTVSGPNMWMASIPLAWSVWCWGNCPWRKSPVISAGPPVVIRKDAFFKVTDEPPVAGSDRYRNDQGVM